MALTFARLVKQEHDAVTVSITWCSQCGAQAGDKCRRNGKERATPCTYRQYRGEELRFWIFLVAWTRAVLATAGT
jgi:hypothetical protein